MLRFIFITIISFFTFTAAFSTDQEVPITPEVFQPLSGLYTGTLTYTNYGDGKLVTMPLLANMTVKGNDLNFNIEINEGGKRYAQNYTYTIKDGGFKGYDLLDSDLENGMLVLTNRGKDADRPAQFRHTFMFTDEGIRITKEVKFLDKSESAYFIRNQYTYERMMEEDFSNPEYADIDGGDVAQANVTIPGKQAFILGEYEENAYTAKLDNVSGKPLEIAIYSKETGERTGGFGLGARGKTKLQVGADQVIHILNPHKSKVVVRAKLTRQVEGMRFRELD